MAQSPELKRVKRHLYNARRETILAGQRMIDCPVDFRPGHIAEMRRRLERLQKVARAGEQAFAECKTPEEFREAARKMEAIK